MRTISVNSLFMIEQCLVTFHNKIILNLSLVNLVSEKLMTSEPTLMGSCFYFIKMFVKLSCIFEPYFLVGFFLLCTMEHNTEVLPTAFFLFLVKPLHPCFLDEIQNIQLMYRPNSTIGAN